MSSLVLDNSVVLAWCLADETALLAQQAMRQTAAEGAVAPGIWWYELRNALLSNERRGRLSTVQTRATLRDIAAMRIELDWAHDPGLVVELARDHRLSCYDAAYLEVAMRRACPLATLDRRLRKAAAASHIELFGEQEF